MTLTIAPASLGEKPVMARLLQLYLHDFSELANIASPYGELGGDGTFRYDHFDSYWSDPDREPLLARYCDQLAGFALINQQSVTGLSVDFSIAEFFVLRKYRGAGVGRDMACQIIQQRPGLWEIPIAAYNQPALHFWRKATAALPDHGFHEVSGDQERWTGQIMRTIIRE